MSQDAKLLDAFPHRECVDRWIAERNAKDAAECKAIEAWKTADYWKAQADEWRKRAYGAVVLLVIAIIGVMALAIMWVVWK